MTNLSSAANAQMAGRNRNERKLREEIASLKAELARIRGLPRLTVLDAEIASLKAENTRLQGRIAQLYLAEKNQILSAKSVEYDIAALQAENARLRTELLQPLAKGKTMNHAGGTSTDVGAIIR